VGVMLAANKIDNMVRVLEKSYYAIDKLAP